MDYQRLQMYIGKNTLQGTITDVNDDGSYNVLILGRPVSYEQVYSNLSTRLYINDLVLLGFYDNDNQKPFIKKCTGNLGMVSTEKIPDNWLQYRHDFMRSALSLNTPLVVGGKNWDCSDNPNNSRGNLGSPVIVNTYFLAISTALQHDSKYKDLKEIIIVRQTLSIG